MYTEREAKKKIALVPIFDNFGKLQDQIGPCILHNCITHRSKEVTPYSYL